MARVTDVQGYQDKFENQMALLDDADIDERDRQSIQRWVAHLRTNDSRVNSLGTVVGHLNSIRLSAERAQMPLSEFETIDDVNSLELYLQDVHGLSDGTIRNYKKSLRKFYIYLYGEDDFGDEISIGPPIQREHDPADNITADELRSLLDACGELDMSSRDRAMIALLRDTGLRLGAVLSLQLKHINFETTRGTLSINEEANVKGASGSKPVTWSRTYVSNWLDDHPRADVPEAPLIHKDITRFDPSDPDDDGALRQQYAGQRISRLAERAGLDPDRIHAHLFRGTAISEWILDDINGPMIEHRVDWTEGSRERAVYQRITDDEFNATIHKHYGIEGDDETGSAEYRLEIDDCPVCKTTLSGTEVHCPQCGAHLDSAAAKAADNVDDDVGEFMIEEDDRDRRKAGSELADALQNDPQMMRAFLDRLEDHFGG